MGKNWRSYRRGYERRFICGLISSAGTRFGTGPESGTPLDLSATVTILGNWPDSRFLLSSLR
jgi:hypothetical protein